MNISENINKFRKLIPPEVTLVAVSKTRSGEEIMEAYSAGQRSFGENKIQEMTQKWEDLPKDIEWHMIGHVQRNKVKYMAPFVSLVHAVDSLKLLKEIEKEAAKNDRVINCLLQIKIAEEESKYGINVDEAIKIINSESYRAMEHVKIIGLMGMATLTDDESKIRKEFSFLKNTLQDLRNEDASLTVLSMGMSGDFEIALECGSNMLRLGSSIFGERNFN